MSEIAMIVTVEESHMAHIDGVRRSLEGKGFRVRDTISRARSITGYGDESSLSAFARIEGVKSVRPDRGFQLPPMREDIPQ